MRYFLGENELKFYQTPQAFSKYTNRDCLKYAIGANLYMPATQESILEKLIGNKFNNLGAITLCLEDSIVESMVGAAQQSVLNLLNALSRYCYKNNDQNLPLIFLRVRGLEQFSEFSKMLTKEHVRVLCGFTFPKFNSGNAMQYFAILESLSNRFQEPIYGIPILEDPLVMYKETRYNELEKIQTVLAECNEYVLNLRVGGTDFSSVFGLRRDVATTIYDLVVVQDCLKDILNYFLRYQCGYVISGPVWEHYSWNENSPEIQGLKKELYLDIQNGFHGKTIIHPSQIDIVNKAYIVNYEDFQDAKNILASDGGVKASVGGNRMNEANPHKNWAKKILAKAEIYGVADINTKI